MWRGVSGVDVGAWGFFFSPPPSSVSTETAKPFILLQYYKLKKSCFATGLVPLMTVAGGTGAYHVAQGEGVLQVTCPAVKISSR